MPRFLSLSTSFTLIALALGGCAGTAGDAALVATPGVHLRTAPGADVDTGWQGDRSTVRERLELVARTAEEWQRLWDKVGLPVPTSLPRDRMAAALFLGVRATSGHAVTLDAASPKAAETLIPYREAVPGPDDPIEQTPTAPFAIRLIELRPGPVSFALTP